MLVRIIKNNISFIGHETIFSCFRFVLEFYHVFSSSFIKKYFRTLFLGQICNGGKLLQLICLHSHVQFIDLRHVVANIPKTFELTERVLSSSLQHRLHRTLACRRILHARKYVRQGPRSLPTRPNDSGRSPLRFVARTPTTVIPTSNSSNWDASLLNGNLKQRPGSTPSNRNHRLGLQSLPA